MATELEVRERQKEKLYILLEIEALNKDIKVKGLRRNIQKAKVGMNKEDIADVEKLVNEMSDWE